MRLTEKCCMPLVLQSLPINRDLKRYWWNRYLRMRRDNGPAYAGKRFTELREGVMEYLDCEARHSQLERILKKVPFRANGWLRALFKYADTQPHVVLQFLKLYTSEEVPAVSVPDAARAQAAVLNRRFIHPSYVSLPEKLRLLLDDAVRNHRRRSEGSEAFWLQDPAQSRFLEEVYHDLVYVKPMDDRSSVLAIQEDLPVRSDYKDWRSRRDEQDAEVSPRFAEDLAYTRELLRRTGYPVLESALPEEFTHPDVYPDVQGVSRLAVPVGHVVYLPKKGSYKRRPVAYANRVLNAMMAPLYKPLYEGNCRWMARNAMYDQSRFDDEIQQHLESDYAGSVDLSQATDNLPMGWFVRLMEDYILKRRDFPEAFLEAWALCKEVSLGPWISEGSWVTWHRGQPLGTRPSFPILTMTHELVIEALAYHLGIYDHPYVLLGDDVVFFSRRLRESYILFCEEQGVPLSLHKSYDGRLTEFAGKVFIVHQPVRYCPETGTVYWSNLFDYQRAAGVRIAYKDLPVKVRRRLVRTAEHLGVPGAECENLYLAMQAMAGVPTPTQILGKIGPFIQNYGLNWPDDDVVVPDDFDRRLSYFLFEESPGSFGCSQLLPDFRHQTKDWFAAKYRPQTTDALLRQCCPRAAGDC